MIALQLALLAAAVQVDDLPARLSLDPPGRVRVQEEPPAQDPVLPPPSSEGDSAPFVDLDWLEYNPRLGFAVYSEDFESDSAFSASLVVRAPMPWLSPASDPEGEYFGLFGEIAITSVDRDLEPELEQSDGVVFYLGMGVDYTLVRSDSWVVLAQAGGGYISYGDVTDLNDGFAPMVGLTAGFSLSPGFTVTYSPEVLFGNAGDHVIINSLGVMLAF